MRKLLLTFCMIAAVSSLFGQIPDHAIGARFGGTVNALGAEASWQIGVSDETRVELDLGFGINDGLTVLKGVGEFQWQGLMGGDFYWYGGPAIAAGAFQEKKDAKNTDQFKSFFHIGAVLGIEYYFDEFPLQISVDFRPEYPIGDSYTNGDFDNGLGVGIRYILEW